MTIEEPPSFSARVRNRARVTRRKGREALHRARWLTEGVLARHGVVLTDNARRVLELAGRHRGQRCFLLGNGPSLRISDLDRLRGEHTFAANRIFLSFGETAWRPTYYLIEDRLLYLQDRHRLPLDQLAGSIRLFPRQVTSWARGRPDGLLYNLRAVRPLADRPRFSTEPIRGLFWGATVMYAMLQLAAFMGFDDVYLVGVDFKYTIPTGADAESGTLQSVGQTDHFHPGYRAAGEVFHAPKLTMQRLAFEAAREHARAHGRRIWNATRGGELEVFERADLDRVLADGSRAAAP